MNTTCIFIYLCRITVHLKLTQCCKSTVGRKGLHSQPVCAQLCLTLCDSMNCNLHQAPLSMEYRQEYWSGLPFPSPGDLLNPAVKPTSLASPALAGGFFIS